MVVVLPWCAGFYDVSQVGWLAVLPDDYCTEMYIRTLSSAGCSIFGRK